MIKYKKKLYGVVSAVVGWQFEITWEVGEEGRVVPVGYSGEHDLVEDGDGLLRLAQDDLQLVAVRAGRRRHVIVGHRAGVELGERVLDRKSTRLYSSHRT